jgi:hypothetical protein
MLSGLTGSDARRHILYKRDVRELDEEIAGLMLAGLDADPEADYAVLHRAAVFRDPPPVLYHTAPVSRRAVIAASGLKACQPGQGGAWALHKEICKMLRASQRPGVYVARKPDKIGLHAHWAAWDVWEVERLAIPWRHDLVSIGCWSLDEDVPAAQVRLHGTFGRLDDLPGGAVAPEPDPGEAGQRVGR